MGDDGLETGEGDRRLDRGGGLLGGGGLREDAGLVGDAGVRLGLLGGRDLGGDGGVGRVDSGLVLGGEGVRGGLVSGSLVGSGLSGGLLVLVGEGVLDLVEEVHVASLSCRRGGRGRP